MSFPNNMSGSSDNLPGPVPCRRFIEQCSNSVTAGVAPGGSNLQSLITNYPNSSYTFVSPVGELPTLTWTDYDGEVSLNSISCPPGWNYITTGFYVDTPCDFTVSFVGNQGVPMFSPLARAGLIDIQSPEDVLEADVTNFQGKFTYSRWIYCGLAGEGQSDDPNVTNINKMTVCLRCSSLSETAKQFYQFYLNSMSMNALVVNAGIA